MTEPETYRYISQGLRLNVCAWGPPDAPPLVLLHGVRDHARAWDHIAAAFADRWRVLAPDLRGHGDSEWAKGGFYPTEAYIYDLAEFGQSLDRFAIVGHSLGGNIGLRYAALFREKVRRIVAIEGLSHAPRYLAERKPVEQRLREGIARAREIAARPPRRYASVEEAVARFRAEHPRLDPDIATTGLSDNGDGTFSFKFDPALRAFPPVEMSAEDAQRLWGLIECPALLVYGADSWASNPLEDGRAAHLRDASVLTLEGAGHWAHHDRREEFLRHAAPFLDASA